MMRSKRGLKALALCGLVLAAAVLGTSAVQAEEGAEWKVQGASLGSLRPEVVMQIGTAEMVLLFKIGASNVDLLCTEAKFVGTVLEPEGKVGGGNTVRFTSCKTKINGTVSAACEPRSPGLENGVLESTSLTGSLMLSGGQAIILFEPVSGTTFLNVELGKGLCAVGNKCTVTGKNSVKDAEGELEVEKVEHLVEQGPIAELAVGANPASVDGAAWVKLAGAHQGLTWSGVPG